MVAEQRPAITTAVGPKKVKARQGHLYALVQNKPAGQGRVRKAEASLEPGNGKGSDRAGAGAKSKIIVAAVVGENACDTGPTSLVEWYCSP